MISRLFVFRRTRRFVGGVPQDTHDVVVTDLELGDLARDLLLHGGWEIVPFRSHEVGSDDAAYGDREAVGTRIALDPGRLDAQHRHDQLVYLVVLAVLLEYAGHDGVRLAD